MKRKRIGPIIFSLLIPCLLLLPHRAAAQFYQYTDEKGNVVITDAPPQGREAKKKELRDDSVSWSSRSAADIPTADDGERGRGASTEEAKRKPDFSSVTVVMYRTNWCGYCKQAAAYVRSLGAGLIEYDIDRDADKKAEMKKKSGGSTAVPLLDIDGTIIRGYSPPAIRAAIERSAAR